jgi:single-strand DNA-binding protein
MNFEGINSVELQGELCWPELKYTQSGKALLRAKIGIPTTDERAGIDKTSYVRVVAWEEFAEYMDSLEARSRVRVSGRIQERSFQNREGKKQNITEIVIDGVEPAESDEGINRFYLRGEIVWPELKEVGEQKTPLFKSKVVVPFYRDDDPENQRKSYIRITAWDSLASDLGAAGEGAVVEVSGHIQERSWQPPQGPKRLFTDAIVTNFVPGAAADVA